LTKVNITARAKQEYFAIIKHLSEKWTAREIDKFVLKFEKAIGHLKSNPATFLIAKKNIHKYVIDKHNTIFYLIKEDATVDVLSIWAGKKNPKKLKL